MKNILTGQILQREIARILWEQLEAEGMPEVKVTMTAFANGLEHCIRAEWSGRYAELIIDVAELGRSLDEFMERHLLALVADLCGRPLLNDGRIVVNQVQDQPLAA